jgi:small subunit ribosomal protein S6
MNHYETVFIMTPVLAEEQLKEAVKKYAEMLTNAGAEIINDEDWGLKQLAYTNKKKGSGFYHLFEFKAEGKVIADLETAFKRDERMLRFLTVKLDKHAVEYAVKRKNKYANKSEN